jgi:cell division protein FtsL
MNPYLIQVIEFVLALIIVPYLVWTVTSIFSMRQELALLRQDIAMQKDALDQNKEIHKLLLRVIEKLEE